MHHNPKGKTHLENSNFLQQQSLKDRLVELLVNLVWLHLNVKDHAENNLAKLGDAIYMNRQKMEAKVCFS